MSEKRFTVMKKFDGSYVICDKGKMLVADDCCDLLNTMSDDIDEVEISIKLFEDDVQIKDKKIEEQQATIKVYEEGLTMKIKKINEQQSTITRLEEENEQLRKELGDCEKFRYQVFKRMNDEYIKERSIK